MRVLSVLFAAAALLSTSVYARPSPFVHTNGAALLATRETREPVLMRHNDVHAFATTHETAVAHLDTARQAHITAAAAHTNAHDAHLAAFSRHPTQHLMSGQHVNEMEMHAAHAEAHQSQADTLKDLAQSHRDNAAYARTYGLPPHHEHSMQAADGSLATAHSAYEHATNSAAAAHACLCPPGAPGVGED